MYEGRRSGGSTAKIGGSMAGVSQTPVTREELIANESSAGTLDSGDPSVHCALATPGSYEPGYSYPLIVWFHDYGADETEMLRVLPTISDRNYAGLSLRGPLPIGDGVPSRRRWSVAAKHLTLLEDELAVGLQHAAEHLNIRWNRVMVAGMGEGATIALRLLLRRPEWFAGAISLGGEWPPETRLPAWGRYAEKHVWLGHIGESSDVTPRAAIRRARLLRAAGFDVTARLVDYDQADAATLGVEIDRWLMRSLCADSVVL